ncbi:pentatricopeptide repeat-containing protein At4g20770-like [Amaranthus tricolor]|uniref:pentatricopeptide repeat-containing protein At4g20770-like n=1 Tax=Amaranthus tricolor TaxID=29722 RepID=UPI002584945C|nr:pentatricopeptide repeat-containing protein At4g20770-like [Amaranthus tricolor]
MAAQNFKCLKAMTNDPKLWHRRLGHINTHTMHELISKDLVKGLPALDYKHIPTCDACIRGKQVRSLFKLKKMDTIQSLNEIEERQVVNIEDSQPHLETQSQDLETAPEHNAFDTAIRNSSMEISCLQSHSKLKEIKVVYDFILKSKMKVYVFVDNNLINGYLRFGKLKEANKVFDEISERSVAFWTAMQNRHLKFGFLRVYEVGINKQDIVAWTTMITSCSQQGYSEKAFSLLSRMLVNRHFLNKHTICSVLKACGEEKALKFGRQLHGITVKKLIKNNVYTDILLVNSV